MSPRGRDTTGKPMDPEERRKEEAAGDGASDEEFSGEVHVPDEDAEQGAAVQDVDFSEAVSDGKADVQTVVQESRVHDVLGQIDHELIALDTVKQRIREIAALLVIDKLRQELDLPTVRPTLHMSFTGSPGTGKTTVALKMAEILYRLGYVEKGHLVAVTRDDLVGQYVGHTAPKTKDVVKRAYGGVLFIDEAYYLYRPENERDYGQEAIEVLLTAMEQDRDKFVVIMAGYKEKMDPFFEDVPGLGSRIAHHIHFPDYSPDELMQIADLMIDQQGYKLSDEAKTAFHEYIERRIKRPRFAHGRSIRNAIERARLRQAMRLFESDGQLTEDDLLTLEGEDIRGSSVFTDTEEEEPESDSEEEVQSDSDGEAKDEGPRGDSDGEAEEEVEEKAAS